MSSILHLSLCRLLFIFYFCRPLFHFSFPRRCSYSPSIYRLLWNRLVCTHRRYTWNVCPHAQYAMVTNSIVNSSIFEARCSYSRVYHPNPSIILYQWLRVYSITFIVFSLEVRTHHQNILTQISQQNENIKSHSYRRFFACVNVFVGNRYAKSVHCT